MSTLKIAVVTGGHSYEVVPFHALFRALPEVDAYIQHIDDFSSSPPEVRDGYDAVVFYIMPPGAPTDKSPWFSGKPKSAFEHLGETTQGIVLLHHAILAYPDWPVWDEMVGMQKRVISKYSHDERIPVQVAQPGHPIVQGVTPWTIVDETYVLHDPGPDSQVLLTTDHPECMRSLAWTRTYRNARVFCYESGHDHQAYEDANFQAVLANGIHWTAGK
jgi:uncharacterized protein